MLKNSYELRNVTHTLYSAISCAVTGAEVWNHCSEARLTMRDFTSKFLLSYFNGNPANYLSSVGAYKLEENGIQLFEKIEGDYFTILGLPILPLLGFLRSAENYSVMKRACVIGWPIAHSRSPLIHNYWLKKYGIDAVYEKKAVEPTR